MSNNVQCRTAAELVWACLNDTALIPNGPDRDQLGLVDVKGFEVYLDRSNPQTADLQVVDLTTDSVQQWLEKDSITTATTGNTLRLKLLVGDQAVGDDTLRPPLDAGAEQLSRGCIYRHFGIPPIASEKMCQKSPWLLDFPQDTAAGHSKCRGIGTSEFSLVWTLTTHDLTTRAMLIIFRGTVPSPRDALFEILRKLGPLADLPAYLPLSTLNIAVPMVEKRLSAYKNDIRKSDLAILRLSDMRAANSVFRTAHTLSSSNAVTAQDARNLLRLAEMLPQMPQRHHRKHAVGTRSEFQAKNREFHNVLRFCRNYLDVLIGEAGRNQENLSRQLETVQQQLSIRLSQDQHELAQAARREQDVSTEIAKASKDIAQETKKDGKSMKTLSVVAMFYLPATTMASIFAMPLFDWDAQRSSSVVNPRIWIYVVSALIVTGMTVGLWWLWLWRAPIREAREKASAINNQSLQVVV